MLRYIRYFLYLYFIIRVRLLVHYTLRYIRTLLALAPVACARVVVEVVIDLLTICTGGYAESGGTRADT